MSSSSLSDLQLFFDLVEEYNAQDLLISRKQAREQFVVRYGRQLTKEQMKDLYRRYEVLQNMIEKIEQDQVRATPALIGCLIEFIEEFKNSEDVITDETLSLMDQK